ncbi:MAG: 16S rRNA (adenine(1518)-N(6)/adenine(1519)-N(6))-dimethyltransferase RsmA [Gammaproteobacteria bacterium]|nr:16S rRNA (adenine(1518)-N(6)/adenine(1519)-N(6))-dimethyltransferase RsmA [Gammaproteobacteria bacterium]
MGNPLNHRPRKRFGQNFLQDQHVIQRIVHSIQPREGQHLVEIGPGQGAITIPVLEAVGEMDVIELDRDLIEPLQQKLGRYGQPTIHQADALKFDFCGLRKDTNKKLRVIGNLPYNISTPLLFHLMEQAACIEDMHFMLQKEVVERMVASPGSKDYGRLSVMLAYHCEAQMLFVVGPDAFHPPPKVDSAIVRLLPHPRPPVELTDPEIFSKVVSQSFSQRRKTLRNNLKGMLDAEAIQQLGIDPGIRAEQLHLEEFARLANAVAANLE